jgi:hypothetical protein
MLGYIVSHVVLQGFEADYMDCHRDSDTDKGDGNPNISDKKSN